MSDSQIRSRCAVLLEQAQPLKELAITLRGPDSATTKVNLSIWPVFDTAGTLSHFEGALWDPTDLSVMGDRESSAVDMEQLASAVSHDLQDPLQLISQYARLLMERHSGALDNDAHRLISRVTQSATRMQAMIDGILAFSRVAHGHQSLTTVDVNEVVGNAISNLQVRIEDTGAQIFFDALPSVIGEPHQLTQLFQNLIGNAIKFHGQAAPIVKISHEESEDDWLMTIADNGLGIEASAYDRVFDLFQRLHTSEEIPGQGIGLAICKRIVDAHAGRIWVESTPGQGSTFFITLPKYKM